MVVDYNYTFGSNLMDIADIVDYIANTVECIDSYTSWKYFETKIRYTNKINQRYFLY